MYQNRLRSTTVSNFETFRKKTFEAVKILIVRIWERQAAVALLRKTVKYSRVSDQS